MPANDTYGETTPQEHASMRANASACLTCGMLATVDPVSHQDRYGHVPVIAGDAGSLVWSADRLSWIPAEIRFANVSNPAAFGAEWSDADGGEFQLVNSRGTGTLMLGIKHGDRWASTQVTSPERFGMRNPPKSWAEFAHIVRAFLAASTA